MQAKNVIRTSSQASRDNKWLHLAIVLVVYSITGTASVFVSRLLLNGAFHLDGSFLSGPWSYRLIYLLVMPPTYSAMLIAIGTLFGKHDYFRNRVLRMWSRILPIRRLIS